MTDRQEDRAPRIDGYDSWSPLGRGSMGIVYRARQRALDRWVAVKVLPPAVQDAAAARERFRDEARRLARVGHPNVVPIHTFGEADGRPYFTMTYVEGESLERTLRAAALGDESRFGDWFQRGSAAADLRAEVAACVVTRAIADALEHLHGLGVVHGDVKPANVLLDGRGRPILVDLGIAFEPAARGPKGRLASASGTLRYMAPEALTPAAAGIGPRADVYALGLLLFELLTLRPAFAHDDAVALTDAIRRGEKPSLRDVDPGATAALGDVVERATARDPADRFASATQLALALRDVTGSLTERSEIARLALDRELERTLAGRRRDRGMRSRLRELFTPRPVRA